LSSHAAAVSPFSVIAAWWRPLLFPGGPAMRPSAFSSSPVVSVRDPRGATVIATNMPRSVGHSHQSCRDHGGTAVASGKVPRCKKITVKGERWGVHVASGKGQLRDRRQGAEGSHSRQQRASPRQRHPGPSQRRLGAPYDQMGIVACKHQTKPVANAGRQTFGLNCASGPGEPACPASGES
jgi:hypothetical protein